MKFSRTFIATMILSLLITSAVTVFAKTNYPKATGYITDTVGILTQEQKQTIESDLENFTQKTSNEIAVLIVKTTAPETIEEYSIHVTDNWKIGDKKLDNGVLFTIATDDRTMRLEIGQGLEGALTDLTSTKILDNFARPRFREGNFYQGIIDTLDIVKKTAKGEFDIANLPTQNPKDDPLSILFTVLFFFVPLILSFFASHMAKSKDARAGTITGGITAVLAAIVSGGLNPFVIVVALVGGSTVGYIFDKIVSETPKGPGGRGGGFWGGFGGGSGFGGGGSGGFGGFGGGGFSGGGGSSKW